MCEDVECLDRPLITDDDQNKTLKITYDTRHHTDNQRISKDYCELVTWLHVSILYLSTLRFERKNLMNRIFICDSFLKRNENIPFLKQMKLGDEKWIVHNNVKYKR